MKKIQKTKLILRTETVRTLSPTQIVEAIGAHGAALNFSDPRKSCDSCSNCPCSPK